VGAAPCVSAQGLSAQAKAHCVVLQANNRATATSLNLGTITNDLKKWKRPLVIVEQIYHLVVHRFHFAP
jgi:hypothetical protein